MNPLSPLTYYRRHKGQALLLLVLIGTLTLGVFVMVGVLSTAAGTMGLGLHHLARVSRIVAGQTLSPGTVTQLRAHPDVAAVLPENGLTISVPSLFGRDPHTVLGVRNEDLAVMMEAYDLRLKEGRLIEPRSAEIVLSEEIVRALGLQIGDRIGHSINKDLYPTVATELTLVGILESIHSEDSSDIQLGFVSYEYLEGHEDYQPRLSNLLIIPRPGRRTVVNDFAEVLIGGNQDNPSVRLETFEREMELIDAFAGGLHGMYLFADGVVALSAALVVGIVNQIAIAQRLPELGLLQAVGYGRRRLLHCLVLEIAVLTAIGWASGLLLSVVLCTLLNATLLAAIEPAIDLTNPVLFLLTLPMPVAVVSWVSVGIRRVLNRLDPVAIIERGKLSMEEVENGKQATDRRQASRLTDNPLSSWTFYRRHRRRSLGLLLSTSLLVLSVAFPPFITAMADDTTWPATASYTSHASVISPASTYQAVDPVMLAQIRAHPAVSRVIPVKRLSLASYFVIFEYPFPIYGVREGDLPVLLDLYHLHLGEGQLPQPRSAQIVLTRALAQNRGLHIGDTVGRPVNELDSMPTELTVVGLLDSAGPLFIERKGYDIPTASRWVGFAPFEFVESHERYSAVPTHALILPVEGHEGEVEAWLEENITSPQVVVETFGAAYRTRKEATQRGWMFLALTESILAVVAALALAILNTISVTQRQDEFGILHAVGHSRTGLVGRTLRESIGIAVAAWLIGAACCAIFVLVAQTVVYAPRGLSLDLTNSAPWLFTLPIPLAVVIASVGTIAWSLSRLDPVAIIERR